METLLKVALHILFPPISGSTLHPRSSTNYSPVNPSCSNPGNRAGSSVFCPSPKSKFLFSSSLPAAPAAPAIPAARLRHSARRSPAWVEFSPSPRFTDHQSGRSAIRGVHTHRNHRGFPRRLRCRRSPSSSASFASTSSSAACAASVWTVSPVRASDLDASSLAYFNTAKRGVAPSLTSNLLSLLFPSHYATPAPDVPLPSCPHAQFASRDELFIPAGADNAFLIDDLLVGTVRLLLRFHVETRGRHRLHRGF